ncbi:MAG: S8 family serine peptidase [Deltaproteobacteria bacterium]|nr:S8 family serine peptidase [Deltaproteobacteria bacterium]
MVSLLAIALAVTADRQIVSLQSSADRPRLEAFVRARGGAVACPMPAACIVTGADVRALPFLADVQQDSVMTQAPTFRRFSVSTADCGQLWDLNELGAESVWASVKGDQAPVIAVMDSGFRTAQPDLAGRLSGQWDYGENDGVANVAWAGALPHHGTFIMGLIAAKNDNNTGRAGLAPNARLFAQKIADDDGALYFSYAINALAAIADGTVSARVVSYSLSSANPPKAFHDAIAALDDAGVVLVAAASNCIDAHCHDADNDADPLYPASSDGAHILSVASSTSGGGFNSYSHYGQESVDLAAPGVDVCSLSAANDNSTFTASGTSYAAPLVAAAVALAWEAHPNLTHREVVRLVKASAKPNKAWEGRVLSGGVLDPVSALATPMPRASGKDATLTIENVAAAGKASIVFFHDGGVELERPSGVTARPFLKNEVLGLPGLSRAPGPGTLWTVDLDAHATASFTLARKDPGGKSATVSARVLVKAQALALGAPKSSDPSVQDDASGQPALVLKVPPLGVPPPPEKPAEKPTLESPRGAESSNGQGEASAQKPAATTPAASDETPAPHGCHALDLPGVAPLAVLLFFSLRRRRRS